MRHLDRHSDKPRNVPQFLLVKGLGGGKEWATAFRPRPRFGGKRAQSNFWGAAHIPGNRWAQGDTPSKRPAPVRQGHDTSPVLELGGTLAEPAQNVHSQQAQRKEHSLQPNLQDCGPWYSTSTAIRQK